MRAVPGTREWWRWFRTGSLRLAAVAVLVPLLGGCLPIPDLRIDLNLAPPSYRVPLEQVGTEYIVHAGYSEPNTPDPLNRTAYLRYFHDPDPSVIVLLMPGIFGGAGTFDPLARQLVASTEGLEVWAIDRRANLLEDRDAFERSLASGDPAEAYRYYIENWGEEGGFEPPSFEEVPFLRHWSLEVHLRDLHRTVLRARERADYVLLGGHSLGAALVSLYAAFEVSSVDRARHGEEFIDALLLLDGALGRTGGFARRDIGFAVGPLRLAPSVEQLEAGEGNPYSASVISPRYQVERLVTALFARLAPFENAPAPLSDIPITNRALVGVKNDDEYGPVPVFGTSLGHAVGAEFDGNLGAVILGGVQGVTSRSVVGVASGFDRVTWAPGNPERERTDIDSYIRAWTLPQTDFAEWYFPLRLALDMTLLEPSLEAVPGFAPNREVTLPTLALGAGRGLIQDPGGFRTYANVRYGSPITAYVFPGLTHIDIVTARNNPAVPILQRWIAFFRSELR